MLFEQHYPASVLWSDGLCAQTGGQVPEQVPLANESLQLNQRIRQFGAV